MTRSIESDLGRHLRSALESRSQELAAEWLTLLIARLPESPARIFPEKTLLNHIPLLLRRAASTFDGQEPTTREDVREELRLLAELRRSQGYGVDEVVEEFDLLGQIVTKALEQECLRFPGIEVKDALTMSRRLQRSLDKMTSVTMRAFELGVNHDLAKRSELLDEFSRIISHELRNRLNSVSLAVNLCRQMARTEQSGSELVECLAGIEGRLARVADVVPDVFAVAVAHGRADPESKTICSLDELISDVVEDLAPLAVEKRIEISKTGEIPHLVVDASRARLILVNLISNAIKYSDPGQPEPWVKVAALANADGARVSVTDNGIGVARADQERIFEAYERGGAVGDRDGLGLGLALAAKAAEQLGAKLWIESGRNPTVFCFEVRHPADSLTKSVLLSPTQS